MKKKYLNNIDMSDNFGENSFVALLFPLLYKNGVNRINQEHLIKQLFMYKQSIEYSKLFKNIKAIRNYTDINEIDIYNGIALEKEFSNNLIDDRERLNLCYGKNVDEIVEFYSQYLSGEYFILMDKMAKEISLINKIEEKSENELLILKENSNRIYELLSGIDLKERTSNFELLTDGDLEDIYYYNQDEVKNCYFNSPVQLNELIKLNKVRALNVAIKHSSYVVMQGLCDDNIRYAIIYTNLLEEDKLNQISDVANTKHYNRILTEDKPYVRKLVLK